MERADILIHFTAARDAGRDSACGEKVDHGSEKAAVSVAQKLTNGNVNRGLAKILQAYPCYWCSGWHVGRAMLTEERQQVQAVIDRGEGVGGPNERFVLKVNARQLQLLEEGIHRRLDRDLRGTPIQAELSEILRVLLRARTSMNVATMLT